MKSLLHFFLICAIIENKDQKEVPEYPEVSVCGERLPAKGIYFRYINGLTMENVAVETYRPDIREDFVKKYVSFR